MQRPGAQLPSGVLSVLACLGSLLLLLATFPRPTKVAPAPCAAGSWPCHHLSIILISPWNWGWSHGRVPVSKVMHYLVLWKPGVTGAVSNVPDLWVPDPDLKWCKQRSWCQPQNRATPHTHYALYNIYAYMQLNFFCFIRFRIYIDPHKYFFAHTLHVYLIHLLIPHNNCFLQFRQIYASVLWIWLEKAGQLHRDPQLTLDPQFCQHTYSQCPWFWHFFVFCKTSIISQSNLMFNRVGWDPRTFFSTNGNHTSPHCQEFMVWRIFSIVTIFLSRLMTSWQWGEVIAVCWKNVRGTHPALMFNTAFFPHWSVDSDMHLNFENPCKYIMWDVF